jgi:hypothetical protein
MSGKPTDDTIALVAFLRGGAWCTASELRDAVAALGFRRPTSQWLTARLRTMTIEQLPRFESKVEMPGRSIYRATHWAETGLSNHFPGFMTKEKAERLAEAQGVWEQAKAEREGQ